MRRLLKHPAYPLAFQLLMTILLIASVLFLILGPQNDEYNPGSYMIWYLWWAALPLTFLVLGRMWCAVCPVGLLSDTLQRAVPPKLTWPSLLRRHELALLTVSLAAAHFLNLWYGFEENLRAGTLFLLLLLSASIVTAALFRRRIWCRTLCPVGALGGLMARLAPLKVRQNRAVCGVRCPGSICRDGTGGSKGCSVLEDPATGIDPHFCTLCGECLKLCPHEAPTVAWFHAPDAGDRAPAGLQLSVAVLVLLGVALDMSVKHLNDWPVWFWQLCVSLDVPPAAWLEMSLHALVVIFPALLTMLLAVATGGGASFGSRVGELSRPLLPLAAMAVAALALRPLLIAGPLNLKAILLSAGIRGFGWLGAARHLDGWPITLLQWSLVGGGMALSWKELLRAGAKGAERKGAAAGRAAALVSYTLLGGLMLWIFSRPMVN